MLTKRQSTRSRSSANSVTVGPAPCAGIRSASVTASIVIVAGGPTHAGRGRTACSCGTDTPCDTHAQGCHEVEALPLLIRFRHAHVRERLPQPRATAHAWRFVISRRPHDRHPLSQPMYITDTSLTDGTNRTSMRRHALNISREQSHPRVMIPYAEHLSRQGYPRTRYNSLAGTVSAAPTGAAAHRQTSRETTATEEQRSRESAASTATRHEPFTTFLAQRTMPNS